MALPLEKFVQQLEDSGILAGETLKSFLPPAGQPKDATELARELVRQKKLTRFQAEEVAKGKGKSLVFGNYVLMEQIGAGGMGQVFKAHHRRMDRFVAVKLLPTAMTKDQAAIARFEREVRAAAKITHSNIVAALDADCANGVHFLVMELVEGDDLSALVKKNGPFSIDKAVNYVLQAARGLEAAHAEGIVHRDIKPANLLLDKKGVVKILDMGLARLNGDADTPAQAELTSTGTIMGTVDYMAPEQALNTKTADSRADIYALGCTLYYLLTGKATYDGDTLMAKLLAHRDQSIPALRTIRPEVPVHIQNIFSKMVAKKVDDRYPNMSQVIADLEGCGTRPELSIYNQQLTAPPADAGMTNFFDGISIVAPQLVPPKKKATTPLIGDSNKNRKWWLVIGGGILGVLILLSGLMITLKTKDGTLIVTVNEQDAEVQVLNGEGKVEISQNGVQGKISISIDPGRHRLKVMKDGFAVFGHDFEIEAGGKRSITAKLMPLEVKAVMAAATSTPIAAGTNTADVAGTKSPLAFETPGFDQWLTEVAALPAEQQVEAVSKKLVELNPGFDGKVSPTIVNGAVTEFIFSADNVTDISPVRALDLVRYLNCQGSTAGKSKLSDLSPLRGMGLQQLNIDNTLVSDLTPLRGMPLLVLVCSHTQIDTLAPLAGMPLISLSCDFTKISDLTPLKGMKLIGLACSHTEISDLGALWGMPIESFGISGTKVSDLSPIKGMPLIALYIDGLQITNLSLLKEVPLTSLVLVFNPGRHTELLRSIKTLKTINFKPKDEFWKEVEEQQKGK